MQNAKWRPTLRETETDTPPDLRFFVGIRRAASAVTSVCRSFTTEGGEDLSLSSG